MAGDKKLIKLNKGSLDMPFLIILLIIVAFGLVMLFSASYANAYYYRNDSFHYIKRQLIFAVAGLVMMFIISKIDYHILQKFALPLYLVSLVLLVLVLIFPGGGNAKRWLGIGSFQFQPSEVAKFAVILICARWISLNHKVMNTFRFGVLPFMIILGLVAVLMVLEPHLSGTILILSIGLVLMFVGGTQLRWFGIGLCVIAAAVTVIILTPNLVSYAQDRVEMWLNPWSDPQVKGYQTIQSLYAIGSGGFMGLGLGNSRQKYLYIPEAQNDFVFSILCEELGFVGATIVIILCALLVWRGISIAMRAKDKFGSILAVGLTMQVGLQAILNIAVVTNTIPNTGISLPFFSYGGTSLIMLLCQMGVILSISRSAGEEKQ